MQSINLKHSVLFFVLAIFLALLPAIRNEAFPVLCFFLVITLGTSHGALDYVKGRAVLKRLSTGSMSHFYGLYVGFSVAILVAWLLSPSTLMLCFLAVACFHFGKEDTGVGVDHKPLQTVMLLTLKGGAVVFAPMALHRLETLELFALLDVTVMEGVPHGIWFIGLMCSWVSGLILGRGKSRDTVGMLQLDFLAVLLLNAVLHPLLAFTTYFCFLHSIRHCMEMIAEFNQGWMSGVAKFTRAAWFLTVVAGALFGVSLLGLIERYPVDVASIKVIFLGLAALTFPHFLLDHLYEKVSSEADLTDNAATHLSRGPSGVAKGNAWRLGEDGHPIDHASGRFGRHVSLPGPKGVH